MKDLSIFSSHYLAPIEYYFQLINSEIVLIDIYEHFVKQTYRNRCRILSPNGVQNLTVPLIKARKRKLTKNVKIAYDDNWRKMHWKSLEAAYRSSPYFEFYEDDFHPFYHNKKYEYLIDLNWDLEEKIISLLGISISKSKTSEYMNEVAIEHDFRNSFSPKKENELLIFNKYIQVFGERNDFSPNMSILDLLFNEGPNSINYLKEIHSKK
ncbi:MAG: WbqC family protein [Vicingus serpentipes]|nr:WbqC family protein [Vicingus serpentipes]